MSLWEESRLRKSGRRAHGLFANAPSIVCSRSALFDQNVNFASLMSVCLVIISFRYDVKDLRPQRLAPPKEPEVR